MSRQQVTAVTDGKFKNNNNNNDDNNDDVWDTNGTIGVARNSSTTTTTTINSSSSKDKKQKVQQTSTTDDTTTNNNSNSNNIFKSQYLSIQQKRHIQSRQNYTNKKSNALLQRHESKVQRAQSNKEVTTSILQQQGSSSSSNDGVGGRVGVGTIQIENDMERTTAITQVQLQRGLLQSVKDRQNIYDIQLGTHYAPYIYKYDRSGRYSIIAGTTLGHLAIMDTVQRISLSEIHLQNNNELIRDVSFLHNHTMYAVAQRNYVYIYDGMSGAEIHCLTDHIDPCHITYLPYHWLLCSSNRMGYIKYHDTSTGSLISTHRTKLGPSTTLKTNPMNAIVHVGHQNGTVTLWSPAQSTYLVKMKCSSKSSTPITDIAIDPQGHTHTMVTCSMDHQIRVWDLRMYQERHSYYCNAGIPTTMDISQRGMMCIGHAGHVTIWDNTALQQKVYSPYMHHKLGPAGMNHACGPVHSVQFRPYEDVCGIGHGNGISSIVVPGSGEPYYDTQEYFTNPNEDSKQRRETVVHSLLDKLMPDMISIDNPLLDEQQQLPSNGAITTTTITTAAKVGSIEVYDPSVRLDKIREIQENANHDNNKKKKKKITKKRGSSKIQAKLRNRQQNVIDMKLVQLQQAAEVEKLQKEIEKGEKITTTNIVDVQQQQQVTTTPLALQRFFS